MMPSRHANFSRRAAIVRLVIACATTALVACNLAGAEPAAPARAPDISVSLRGVLGGAIEVGEPLFVAVRLDHPGDNDAPLQLAPARGSWRDAVSVQIVRSSDGAVMASARPLSASVDASAVLDAEQFADAVWWFPATDRASLPSGSYEVQAQLRIRDGAGWRGDAAAPPIAFEIVEPTGDPARQAQRVIALAHAARAGGAPADAARILDEALQRDPDAISVLIARANLALSEGDARAAAMCLRRARALAATSDQEPSLALHDLAGRVALALADPDTAAHASTWEKLPPAVLAPVRRAEAGAAVVAITPSARAATPAATPATSQSTTARPAAVSVSPAAASAPATPVATTPSPPSSSSAGPGQVVPAAELVDATILADPNGQWAASATASSEYGRLRYGAVQATGAPNIAFGMAGDNPDAWCPAGKNDGAAWLELTFAQPVHATEVRVRQNNAPGAIAKIEAIDDRGEIHLWWEGVDPFVAPAIREIAWFAVRVPPTDYLVAKVRLTLNLATVPGWKQIDAVQLVGARKP